jgi:hypothetical protein
MATLPVAAGAARRVPNVGWRTPERGKVVVAAFWLRPRQTSDAWSTTPVLASYHANFAYPSASIFAMMPGKEKKRRRRGRRGEDRDEVAEEGRGRGASDREG